MLFENLSSVLKSVLNWAGANNRHENILRAQLIASEKRGVKFFFSRKQTLNVFR